jgi:hypothetical protein
MNIKFADLRAAGLTEAQINRVIEVADIRQTEKRQEQNREASRKYRERHQNQQLNADAADAALSPVTTTITTTVSQQKRSEIGALEREFHETFWPAYPNKVAKPAALKAFLKARKRASLETIMAGLTRYASKTDDRHWANGSTWLNNDRWEDQPGPAQEGNGHGRRGQPAPKDDPKSIRGAFDRLFASLDGCDETGEPSRQANLRVIPGGSG